MRGKEVHVRRPEQGASRDFRSRVAGTPRPMLNGRRVRLTSGPLSVAEVSLGPQNVLREDPVIGVHSVRDVEAGFLGWLTCGNLQWSSMV